MSLQPPGGPPPGGFFLCGPIKPEEESPTAERSSNRPFGAKGRGDEGSAGLESD